MRARSSNSWRASSARLSSRVVSVRSAATDEGVTPSVPLASEQSRASCVDSLLAGSRRLDELSEQRPHRGRRILAQAGVHFRGLDDRAGRSG
jgi:hypothetical protein